MKHSKKNNNRHISFLAYLTDFRQPLISGEARASPVSPVPTALEMNIVFTDFFSKISVTKEASLCISTTISSHNNYNYDDDLDDLRGLEETTAAT